MLGRRARVLVTVKAYPNPSQSRGETVCVAGVRLDEPQRSWIRLFPISFRALEHDDQFQKYRILDLEVRPAGDGRTESFRPSLSSIELREFLPAARGWEARWAQLADLAGEITSCRLAANAAGGGPSLGMVKPLVDELDITRTPPFTAEQRRVVEESAAPDLFSPQRSILEPAPFTLHYRYRCVEVGCRGHRQSAVDWEAGQLARKLLEQGRLESEIPSLLRAKFLDQMCGPDRDTYFYLGNVAKHPKSFMVLGVFWPPSNSRPIPTLF